MVAVIVMTAATVTSLAKSGESRDWWLHIRVLYCLAVITLGQHHHPSHHVHLAHFPGLQLVSLVSSLYQLPGLQEGPFLREEREQAREGRQRRETQGRGEVEFVHPKLREALMQEDKPGDDWVWLTSYSRIPVSRSSSRSRINPSFILHSKVYSVHFAT